MKILVVFIDMVRVTELNLLDNRKKETLLDKRLKSIGGTLFTRCYSPGPDTPRSNACMQTGLYPFFNGCNTRIKWPRYFIKENITTIFDHAIEKGFEVNHCVRPHSFETGLLKFKDSPMVHNYNDHYKEFFKKENFSTDSLSFVYTPDWHIANTDLSYTPYAFRKGDEAVDKLFELYLPQDLIDEFDYTIIYSDHGFQFESESVHMKNKLELLDDGRNKLLTLIHKKGDSNICKDDRIASIVDIYATIEQLLGGNDFRQGFSLLDQPQRTITHVEDHQDFRVYPEVMIKQWRVISDEYDIRTDVYTTIDKNGHKADLQLIDTYLRKFSPHYADYVKQLEVWKHYAVLSKEEGNRYMVGLRRSNKFVIKLFRLFHIFRKLTKV